VSDKPIALVVGAGSAIAQAIIKKLLAEDGLSSLIAVSRTGKAPASVPEDPRLRWLSSDYHEGSIAAVAEQLAEHEGEISRVFICTGILHDAEVQPEKRLEDLNEAAVQRVFAANTFTPMLWLKHLKPLLPRREEAVITVFSARVGSITDNRKGGWYTYRASKAALNMALKTASIELRRTHRGLRILAFHPGTTDTPLSKPFQGSVPGDKLFSPEFVAEKLLSLVADLPGDSGIEFRDWEGKTVSW